MIERDNTRLASEALLTQAAAASIMGGEDGLKMFSEMINSLRGE